MDYCDRCGAQAKNRFVLWSGDLLFCAHHGREFGPTIVAIGGVFDIAYAELNDPDLVTA